MFYAVNYVADVWVNGNYAGYHEGGYTPFAFDVSDFLNYGSENVIAIRIDNPRWNTRKDIVPYVRVDWFNYTGLIHDVYLEVSEPINVVRADVVPKSVEGELQTTVTVLNKSSLDENIDVEVEVFEALVTESNITAEGAHNIIGSQVEISGESSASVNVLSDSVNVWRTSLTVANPKLWSVKDPNLYVMKVILKKGGSVVDEYYTQFGIRTVVKDKNKFRINGNVVFLTGVARHEDHPLYGRSIPVEATYQDLLKVKEVHANMLRTAHYPNHVQTYQMADRMGIAIVEEVPVWQFDDENAWDIQNSSRHIHQQMFREMVFKDYNCPSVIMWSTQNESLVVPARKTYIQTVRDDHLANYPDGRLITQSAAADRPGASDDSQNPCDVAGWTMYFGIFHGSEYYIGTNYFLHEVKTAFPDKPVLNTEYGYWSTENGATEDEQVKVFYDTFLALRRYAPIRQNGTYDSTGFVMGITWWCIFDWYRASSADGFQSMGLYNMERTRRKPVGDTLSIYYEPYFNAGGTIVTDVEGDENITPDQFSLEQNYPNPFNPGTKIKFSVPPGNNDQNAKIILYDVLGKEIATIFNDVVSPGIHEVEFNSSKYSLSSGVYYYVFRYGEFISARKMILLK